MENAKPAETPGKVDDLKMMIPANLASTSPPSLPNNQVGALPSSETVSESQHQKRVTYETCEKVQALIKGKDNETRDVKDAGIRCFVPFKVLNNLLI